MRAKFLDAISGDTSLLIFTLISAIGLSGILLGVALEIPMLAALPFALLVVLLAIVDFRMLFYILCFCIPLSIQFNVTASLSTDLPTEPLMVGLMLVYIFYFIKNFKTLKPDFFKHPMTILLLLHVAWIMITSVTSLDQVVSVKFLLAKLWYVVVFYFLAGHVLKTEKALKTFFWVVLIPLFLTVTIVMVRHSTYGFSFSDINWVLGPFYSNHVIYASIIVLFMPFIWLALNWFPKKSLTRFFLLFLMVYAVIAIQFSFTRAAYVSLVLAIISSYVIRFRLMRYALGLSLILSIAFFAFLINKNTYLDYAPNFERAVTHSNFENLLEATTKLEDISTVERFYRWIAGRYMVEERPMLGFGPGNFINYYRSYTVNSFQTYVSDNEENSGVHFYYLMLFIEQGIFGLIIFLILSFYMLIKGEAVYHQCKTNHLKRIVMAALLCIIIVDSLLIMNDMIEVDKIGSFFFMSMALIVNVDLMNKGKLPAFEKSDT